MRADHLVRLLVVMQFLMIARVVEGTPREQVLPLVKSEAAKIWEYYAADRIRAVYYIADMSGAVALWEAASLEEVHEAAKQLPMMQAGALQLEFIPLKPFTGIEQLFAQS